MGAIFASVSQVLWSADDYPMCQQESDAEKPAATALAYTEARRQLVTAPFTTQIELDDRNIAWIAGTKVKVIEVVLDKIAYGSSPEEIHFQHPNLSLAQIHGALTYYYENQDKVDEQIRRGLEDSDKLASHLSDGEFRRKLGNLKRSL